MPPKPNFKTTTYRRFFDEKYEASIDLLREYYRQVHEMQRTTGAATATTVASRDNHTLKLIRDITLWGNWLESRIYDLEHSVAKVTEPPSEPFVEAESNTTLTKYGMF